MILDDATKEAFGYYASELKLKSNRPILAACERCGDLRVTSRSIYRSFCHSCSIILGETLKGLHRTEEAKAKISAARSGKKHLNFGKRGTESTNYKGGKKLANLRDRSKRRQLGSTYLIPLEDGEVGHHVTDVFIIGIPIEVHEKLSGNKRQKHRLLVLEWLKLNDKRKYSLVLLVLKNHSSI